MGQMRFVGMLFSCKMMENETLGEGLFVIDSGLEDRQMIIHRNKWRPSSFDWQPRKSTLVLEIIFRVR